MVMTTNSFTGCCAGRIFYQLGGSHSHPRAKTQEEFDSWLIKLSPTRVNVAITDPLQDVERQYLKTAGWSESKVTDRLYLHWISDTDYNKYTKTAKERIEREKLKNDFKGLAPNERPKFSNVVQRANPVPPPPVIPTQPAPAPNRFAIPVRAPMEINPNWNARPITVQNHVWLEEVQVGLRRLFNNHRGITIGDTREERNLTRQAFNQWYNVTLPDLNAIPYDTWDVYNLHASLVQRVTRRLNAR